MKRVFRFKNGAVRSFKPKDEPKPEAVIEAIPEPEPVPVPRRSRYFTRDIVPAEPVNED